MANTSCLVPISNSLASMLCSCRMPVCTLNNAASNHSGDRCAVMILQSSDKLCVRFVGRIIANFVLQSRIVVQKTYNRWDTRIWTFALLKNTRCNPSRRIVLNNSSGLNSYMLHFGAGGASKAQGGTSTDCNLQARLPCCKEGGRLPEAADVHLPD